MFEKGGYHFCIYCRKWEKKWVGHGRISLKKIRAREKRTFCDRLRSGLEANKTRRISTSEFAITVK